MTRRSVHSFTEGSLGKEMRPPIFENQFTIVLIVFPRDKGRLELSVMRAEKELAVAAEDQQGVRWRI